jgi:hypothetical protein
MVDEDKENKLSSSEFSADERRRLREVLRAYDRSTWLRGLFKSLVQWVAYVAGGVVGLHAVIQQIKDALK